MGAAQGITRLDDLNCARAEPGKFFLFAGNIGAGSSSPFPETTRFPGERSHAAIGRGSAGGTGVALVEVYDLEGD
jgi:hypothetical protein